MERMRDKLKLFFDNYLIVIILLFALLALLPYVSFFKLLQVSYTPGLIYRGVILFLIGLLFVLTIFVYRWKTPIYFYIGLCIYLISQIVTIFASPKISKVEIPELTTIMGLLQATIISISVITYLTIGKCSKYNTNIINKVCLFIIFFGLSLCIYTYVFEYEDIYNTLNSNYGWNYDVTSIFTMKTEYGFVLYICSLFSIVYVLNNKKYWMYIVPLFFLMNMFISRSKTSILCTSIILLTLTIIHLLRTWNIYKRYWIICFAFFGILTIVSFFLTYFHIGWFSKFHYFITQVIFNDAKVVMQDRIHKWGLLIKALNNPLNILFGYGERITPFVLSKCGCATIGDNMYITTYGVGGLIKLTIYFTVIIYALNNSWKGNKNIFNKVICLSFQLSFLIGGLFEDDCIIGVTMSGLFSSIIFHSCNKIIKTDL